MKVISLLLITIAISLIVMLSVKAGRQYDSQQVTISIDQPEGSTIQHLPPVLSSAQNLPFSEAVRAGDTIYLSGMLGTVPGTRNLAPGGVKGETKQILDNLRKILESNGSGLDRIVKCTVILADIKEWGAMNEVYSTYFEKGKFPARTAFGSSGLLFGARVEIECLAQAK
jgi:2-iminobutanoate/2-iminopropanoate deaminase